MLCNARLVTRAASLLRLVAENGGSEAGVSHPGSMTIRNGLKEDGILGNQVPIDLRQGCQEDTTLDDRVTSMYSHL